MNAGASAASFEQVFEDMDVKTAEMNGALDSMTGSSVDNDEVMTLLSQMRDQQTMEANGEINARADQIAGPAQAQPSAAQGNDIDAMQARLNELKNM